MRDPYAFMDARRLAPRIDVEAICTELLPHEERPTLALDLSHSGVRIERPFTGGPTPRDLQLELELPEIDEILWARGEVCFDQVRRGNSPGTLMRTTGIRLAAAAARDLRLLRDFIYERRRAAAQAERAESSFAMSMASCYLRG